MGEQPDLLAALQAYVDRARDTRRKAMGPLTALAIGINQNARDKGFWDGGERNMGEMIALAHSELSEALEEHRKRTPVRRVPRPRPPGGQGGRSAEPPAARQAPIPPQPDRLALPGPFWRLTRRLPARPTYPLILPLTEAFVKTACKPFIYAGLRTYQKRNF